ncbi:MAG: transposase domain-containing protein [Janthinobacterium lividum]
MPKRSFTETAKGSDTSHLDQFLSGGSPCRGLNPHAYLADILGRIAEHPSRQLYVLLPWHWNP